MTNTYKGATKVQEQEIKACGSIKILKYKQKYVSIVQHKASLLTIFPLGSIAYAIGDKGRMC